MHAVVGVVGVVVIVVKVAVSAAMVVGLTVIGLGLYEWIMGFSENPLDDNPFNVTASHPVDLSEAPELGWPTGRYDSKAPEEVREGYVPDQIFPLPTAPDWLSCEDFLCLGGYTGSVRLYDTYPSVSFLAEIRIENEEPPILCRWWRSRYNPVPGCWQVERVTAAERPYDILVKLGATPGQAARLLTPL